jgi:carboxylesterase type B
VKAMMNCKEFAGVSHADELLYLWKPWPISAKPPAIESNEFDVSKNMVGMWTSFAQNGNPNNFIDFKWEALQSDNECLMVVNITDQLELIAMPEEARMKVWDEVFQDAKII